MLFTSYTRLSKHFHRRFSSFLLLLPFFFSPWVFFSFFHLKTNKTNKGWMYSLLVLLMRQIFKAVKKGFLLGIQPTVATGAWGRWLQFIWEAEVWARTWSNNTSRLAPSDHVDWLTRLHTVSKVPQTVPPAGDQVMRCMSLCRTFHI